MELNNLVLFVLDFQSILFQFVYRQPFSFVTSDVVEATTQCLLAQAEETERSGQHSQVFI